MLFVPLADGVVMLMRAMAVMEDVPVGQWADSHGFQRHAGSSMKGSIVESVVHPQCFVQRLEGGAGRVSAELEDRIEPSYAPSPPRSGYRPLLRARWSAVLHLFEQARESLRLASNRLPQMTHSRYRILTTCFGTSPAFTRR